MEQNSQKFFNNSVPRQKTMLSPGIGYLYFISVILPRRCQFDWQNVRQSV